MDLSSSTDTEVVAPAARRAQTVLLLNANAGGGRAGTFKRLIEAHIASLPQRPMLFVSQDAQTANRLVDALPSGSRVIVFGGDGTISAKKK
jgi:diacylglycerol kinase family enzyme